jgi:hypothetical protein
VNAPAGLTELSVGKYAAASWLGMLPGTIAYVLLGSAGKETVVAAGAGNASVNLALYGATMPHESGNIVHLFNVQSHFVDVVLLGGGVASNAAAVIACHMHHLLFGMPRGRRGCHDIQGWALWLLCLQHGRSRRLHRRPSAT